MGVVHELHVTVKDLAVYSYINAVRNDSGRGLRVYIDDMTLASGNTGSLDFKRSDGTNYGINATLDTATNSFLVNDLSQALTQTGVTECQLKVTASNKVVSTYKFNIRVQDDLSGAATPQQGYSIAQAMAEAQAASTAAHNASQAASSALSTAQNAASTANTASATANSANSMATAANTRVNNLIPRINSAENSLDEIEDFVDDQTDRIDEALSGIGSISSQTINAILDGSYTPT